jgi:uncharacterized protein (AIM24 family)
MLVSAMSTISLPVLCDPPARTILPPTAILPPQAQKTSIVKDFGRLPLSFESNQGQADAKVRFLTHSGDNTLFLTPSEAVFAMPATSRQEKPALSKGAHAPSSVGKIRQGTMRMQLVGANPHANVLAQQPLVGKVNYLIGNDPRKWHSDVPTFGRVGFQGVYPGVDMVYYGNQRNLEYDFLVAPHADPKRIRLHFADAQGVHVSAAGDLIVRVAGRELIWRKPVVYQQDARGKHRVAARFRLKRLPDRQANVSFALGHYDADRALVIDPALAYSTFLGGSVDDVGYGIAIDSSNNTYITGSATSTDFPTTSGAFQRTKGGVASNTSAFVTKFNATGTSVLYSTYLGGSKYSSAQGIAVDSGGNAYVTGYTQSSDFPVRIGSFQTDRKGMFQNAFLTKLNSTGTTIVYGTYLGGSGLDYGYGLALDSSGNAYVVGQTSSTDFPTTAGAFQPMNRDNTNGFVSKFNSTGTALLYSTYLGGSSSTFAAGIAVDSSNNAYIAGSTVSTDFPTTAGAFQSANKVTSGTYTGFVTKLNSTGTALLYSTYLGGSGEAGDRAAAIAVDGSGDAYVAGDTSSIDFPITPGAFQQVKKGAASSTTAFVTKFNPTGTSALYSTYLGGSTDGIDGTSEDLVTGIALDNSGNAYIAGPTNSTDFPTTASAFQRVKKGAAGTLAAFVSKFNATGTVLLYSTYLGGSVSGNGGSPTDRANGIVLDSSGATYITGFTSNADFPITSGAYQPTKRAGSGKTAFVTKLIMPRIFPDFNNDGNTDLLLQNPSTGAIATWYMQGSTQVGSAPFSLTPPAEYALVGDGDFFGDGSTTLVLQSSITNQIAFWYTSGANNATIPGGNFVNVTPAAGWKVVGVGDFNGDGKSDLVFQNQNTNQVAIWFMNGYLYQGGVLMPYTPPTGWTVAGVGDFNADGFSDIAFQNQTTGQIALWYMNGAIYAGGTVLTTVPASGWKVVGVGDYNGDGSADLLFQNQTTNQAAVWYLQNGAFAGGDTLSLAPPSGWKIVGPR